ncbi:MAG TPA: Gfo/Idh/MocA family oxidoreductase [Spirochaetia bacterium]|nr:Gfo/Idh/MocA family oxidoreductase [Spirochaetia bacterium]
MQKSDGMNYAPEGSTRPVVKKGEFKFGVIALDHGHINGMANGLVEAGGEIALVWDPDRQKVEKFCKDHPGAVPARSRDEVLGDKSIQLIASAAVTSERANVGLAALDAGKDYFSDKAPFTTLQQLEAAKKKVTETGRIWAVYYSERLHVESAMYAGDLIADGKIGKVIQVIGTGPHRLSAPSRPAWFFEREKYGGILCDIGSHQIEQYLFYAGEKNATVVHSKIANYNHPEYPELEDFGDATLVGENGSTNYFRVDWFTPDGLGTWGDGRTIILGTEGYIELRKYIDVARDKSGDHVYLVNGKEERHINAHGTVGYPFFGRLILDCLNRTHNAMPQEHTFKAAELCLMAEAKATRITVKR